MKKQITRISILQSSKIVTILYFLLGFVYTLIGIPMVLFGKGPLHIMGWVYVVMPLLMTGIGFVAFVICSAVYNLVVGWVGGIEFEVEDVEDEAPSTPFNQ